MALISVICRMAVCSLLEILQYSGSCHTHVIPILYGRHHIHSTWSDVSDAIKARVVMMQILSEYLQLGTDSLLYQLKYHFSVEPGMCMAIDARRNCMCMKSHRWLVTQHSKIYYCNRHVHDCFTCTCASDIGSVSCSVASQLSCRNAVLVDR